MLCVCEREIEMDTLCLTPNMGAVLLVLKVREQLQVACRRRARECVCQRERESLIESQRKREGVCVRERHTLCLTPSMGSASFVRKVREQRQIAAEREIDKQRVREKERERV